MHDRMRLLIGGEWREGRSERLVEVLNPATEETLGTLAGAGEEDVREAIEAAVRGFESWRRETPAKRAAVVRRIAALMRERVDAMARVLTLEQGKTLGEAAWEINATAAYFEQIADDLSAIRNRFGVDAAGIERRVEYRPVGPVFAVSPWNLPAMMPGRKVAGALAAGCSVIMKPASETPATAIALAECCVDAGVPEGAINLLAGRSSMISEQALSSRAVGKLSFTGSTPVGRDLAQKAAATFKKATLELGGHAPVLIFDDAGDIGALAAEAVKTRYSNAGQSCIAPTRFYVQKDVYGEFCEAFREAAAKLVVGDGLDPDTQMGPMASARGRESVERLLEEARGHGARVTAGGSRPAGKGFFFEPTVLEDVPDTAEIMREEPFGPATPIAPFGDEAEAIGKANSTAYGLASYFFTGNRARAARVAEAIDAGLVAENTFFIASPDVPFGGVKDSGMGREASFEGLLEHYYVKAYSVRRPA